MLPQRQVQAHRAGPKRGRTVLMADGPRWHRLLSCCRQSHRPRHREALRAGPLGPLRARPCGTRAPGWRWAGTVLGRSCGTVLACDSIFASIRPMNERSEDSREADRRLRGTAALRPPRPPTTACSSTARPRLRSDGSAAAARPGGPCRLRCRRRRALLGRARRRSCLHPSHSILVPRPAPRIISH